MTVATTSSNAPDTAALLARAAAMRPLLERNADTTDTLRCLPDENVAALNDAQATAQKQTELTQTRIDIEVSGEVLIFINGEQVGTKG
jgi:polyribonucleotide nucleotidyltransferase